MTVDNVAVLDTHRSRRMQRLREGLALYAPDPQKSEVSRCLAAVATATGADRVAVGYVDEFEGTRFRVECLLDLLRSVPRRDFDPLPMESWSGPIPAFWAVAPGSRGRRDGGGGIGVSLGGDGTRSWFLLADSLIPRPALAPSVIEEVLFLAGRCAGILLHGDLREGDAEQPRDSSLALLQDLVGREQDVEVSRRIASRFVLVRALGFAAEGGPLVQFKAQADVCAGELEALDPGDPERTAWQGVVEGLESGDLLQLTVSALAMGEESERLLHMGSAESCYLVASELAAEAGSVVVATDAARFRGRVLRRQGRWTEAESAYEHARALALAARDHTRHGLVVSGMAAIARERGNMPRTRELLMVQLEIGERGGGDGVLAAAHHDLMALDKLTGDLEGALHHGWDAVRLHGEGQGALEALTDVAGVLTEMGSYALAEDAYSIVVEGIDHEVYRVHALAGLAYLAALRGDAEEFARRSDRVEGDLGHLPEALQAELLYERGLSYYALGDEQSAVRWLEWARRRSEAWGVNKVLFDSEAALDEIRRGSPLSELESRPHPAAANVTQAVVGEGLQAMRSQIVGV